MRRCLSLLLILTLVLRGLLGDAMAMGTVAPAAVAHAHAAANAHDTHAAHASQATPAASHCAPQAAPACGEHAAHAAGCSACGICHSALGLPGAADFVPHRPRATRPANTPAHFASAAPASLTKPPISAV